ncbi:MAG: conserved membrane protein of unknown function [Promethearchaeota archaeon]|nr:MAG: conserved membrane protein of unknown function [Candidatus Lokiarchaeota archaeon]
MADTGKILTAVGGILVIVATFLLTWITDGGTIYYGLNFVMNLMGMFTDAGTWASNLGFSGMSFMAYIFAILYILFILSGIFLLIGIKVRALSIIGAIMPLVLGVFLLLFYTFGITLGPVGEDLFSPFGGSFQIVSGILPFGLTLDFLNLDLGALILLVGGVLGIVSGGFERLSYY